MRFKKVLFALFLVLALPAIAFAQDGGPWASVEWKMLVALAINSVVVIGVVQVLKGVLPMLPAGWKQILALAGGPAVLALGSVLSGWLGTPIDLTPIATLLAGLVSVFAAMGLFDVGKKLRK